MGRVSVIALIVAACLSSSKVAAQTVYSTPVGFKKVVLQEGRNFLSSPFTNSPSTLEGVLGTNQLPPSNLVSLATTVDIWNQDNQNLTNRFWLSNADGFEGWRNNSFIDSSVVPIDQSKGMIITLRDGKGPLDFLLVGTVPTTAQQQTVPGGGDYSVLASAFPAEIALADAGLIASGFQGGESLVESDNIIFHNPATDVFDLKVWYDTLFSVWRDSDANEVNRKLKPGESFLVRKRSASAMVWTNPLPYTLSN